MNSCWQSLHKAVITDSMGVEASYLPLESLHWSQPGRSPVLLGSWHLESKNNKSCFYITEIINSAVQQKTVVNSVIQVNEKVSDVPAVPFKNISTTCEEEPLLFINHSHPSTMWALMNVLNIKGVFRLNGLSTIHSESYDRLVTHTVVTITSQCYSS